MPSHQALALSVVLVGFAVQSLAATPHNREPLPGSPKSRAQAEKTPRDRPGEDGRARSGYGPTLGKHHWLSYGPSYKSYYVGGSQAPFRWTPKVPQHPRALDQGTWGTDYAPPWARVRLNWTNGRLYQGGVGQYEPDRKNFPFGLRFGRRSEQHSGERVVEFPAVESPPAEELPIGLPTRAGPQLPPPR